ncbi:MAG: hypothetical protein QOD53_150 [Thermoleophilaceae bacterium]|nr:hypothetical protein [Thermoleophilaceae bacterium]
MSTRQLVRRRLEQIGLSPRYANRFRWLAKARVLRMNRAPIRPYLRYLVLGAEIGNFTYELANEPDLAAFLDRVFGIGEQRAMDLIDEARNDEVLAGRLLAATRGRWWTKTSPPFGRRLGWYAIIRLVKPELVVETGIHDGLGSLILVRALERNAEEGVHGRLVGFDIYERAGWIVGEHPLYRRVIEPTQAALARELDAGPPLGVFIHDSMHTYEHERFELETAADRLAPGGVLISDNAHTSTALKDVCDERGLRYDFFGERPRDHFSPGAGLGAGRSAPA